MGRIKGNYSTTARLYGFKATCPQCGHKWGYYSQPIKEALHEGLDKCPHCGSKAKLKSVVRRIY